MADFEKQKQHSLSQVDLSKKGSIDGAIIDLVDYINGLENYFTTSSCSGRICVFSESPEQKKKCCQWMYVTHGHAVLDTLIGSINNCPGDAAFKFEPFVLHVQCRTLEDAQFLLKVALESGYKNSGIVLGRKCRFMMAVRSTHSLEVPIISRGNLLVSREYIRYIIDIANKKMDDNLSRINRFFTKLKESISMLSNRSEGVKNTQKGIKRTQCSDKDRPKMLENNCSEYLQDDIVEGLANFYGDMVDET